METLNFISGQGLFLILAIVLIVVVLINKRKR